MIVYVMHKMMGLVMSELESGYVHFVKAAVQIGAAIEQEVDEESYVFQRLLKTGINSLSGRTWLVKKEKKEIESVKKRVNSWSR